MRIRRVGSLQLHAALSRGTISPILFSAVLEYALSNTCASWESRRCGLQLGHTEEWLSNLRFADDILLFATSRDMVEGMLGDLITAAEKVGLSLHLGKTKILTNEFARPDAGKGQCFVGGKCVEILDAKDCTMYLGRNLNLWSLQETEVEYRVGAAWRQFMARKGELCGKRYSLRDRLRLFEATVTKSALYGCETWTMTAESRRRLITTQRKMLRWILGSGRKPCYADHDSSSGSSSSGSIDHTGAEPEGRTTRTRLRGRSWSRGWTGSSALQVGQRPSSAS